MVRLLGTDDGLNQRPKEFNPTEKTLQGGRVLCDGQFGIKCGKEPLRMSDIANPMDVSVTPSRRNRAWQRGPPGKP